jgi:hypothetical protein
MRLRTKRCSKCGEVKPTTEFSKNKSNKDGLSGWCKACTKAYREANKEKISAQRKTHYKANKEKIAARSKAWNEANKEKVAAQKKTHYEANKEKILTQQKVHREANKDDWSFRSRRLINVRIAYAKKHGIPYDRDALKALVREPVSHCRYPGCGRRLEWGHGAPQKASPSIDKKVPEKGYVEGNMEIVCMGCNSDKNNVTIERAKKFLKYMGWMAPEDFKQRLRDEGAIALAKSLRALPVEAIFIALDEVCARGTGESE